MTTGAWPRAIEPGTAEGVAAAVQITADRRTDPEKPDPERHRGHLRMAERLVNREHNRLRYVHGEGWRVWDGRRWDRDRDGEARRAAIATVRAAYDDLPELGRDEQRDLLTDIHRAETSTGLEGVLRLASNILPLATRPDRLDADPLLLNTQSGTLDLRTGELLPHAPADLITKICGTGYDRDAMSEKWKRFLGDALPEKEMREYVGRLFGQALEGQVIEHLLPVLVGSGCNGKSTLLNVIGAALGDYAITAEPDLLIDREGGHPTGQADLRGVRLAVCHESNNGARLGAATVKRLTGGDKVRARRMREDFFEFQPSHSIVLVTNHKPVVSGDDHALWRRLRLVPFEVTIAVPDPGLPERLLLELPAVLAWLVAGHRDWQQHGLKEPQTVLSATKAYRSESDTLGRYLDERTLQLPGATVPSRKLYNDWTDWCQANGEVSGTEKAFATALVDRRYEKKRGADGWRWIGVGLAAAAHQQP